MFSGLEHILLSYSNVLSLETFVFVASFIEEVVAPIPSPTVMVLAGSFAMLEERGVHALLLLSIIGAIGKTIGAIFVYVVTDKAENLILGKFGRFFRVTHEDVERLGKRLGNGAKDYALLTFLRALPIMPSVVVSVGSGLLKIPMTLFVVTTFFGTIVRDGIYLYAGYVGTEVFRTIIERTSDLESFVLICVIVFFAGAVGYMLKRRIAT